MQACIKEIVFGLANSVKSSFWSSRVCFSLHQIFRNFDILYSIVHILIQSIQISCLVTYVCAQAVFKVPFSYTFPVQKKVEF